MTEILKECSAPGCHTLIPRGRRHCEDHEKAEMRAYNRSRRADPNRDDSFYSSASWRATRAAFLARHPLCELCQREGRITAATIADHRIARHEGGSNDQANLRSLCSHHHSLRHGADGSRWGKQLSC